MHPICQCSVRGVCDYNFFFFFCQIPYCLSERSEQSDHRPCKQIKSAQPLSGSICFPLVLAGRLSPCPLFIYSPTHPSISSFFTPTSHIPLCSGSCSFSPKLLHYTSSEHPLTGNIFPPTPSSTFLFFFSLFCKESAVAMLFQIIQLLKLIQSEQREIGSGEPFTEGEEQVLMEFLDR